MRNAFINLVQEQLVHNCLLTPNFEEGRTEYGCLSSGCEFKAVFQKNKFVQAAPHTCFDTEYPQPGYIMKYGDIIVLSFSFDEIFEIQLKEGEKFDSRYGQFTHASFVGKALGTKIESSRGKGFVVPLPFSPVLHTEALKRRTQILFTPDISIILGRANLSPGKNVVEAGIGSGSLSHAFMQAIVPTGKLYNYDLYQERVDEAKAEFERFCPGVAISTACDVLEHGFVGVPDGCANLVFLDLPSPERCLSDVRRVARDGAYFTIFLPCAEQVHSLLRTAYDETNKGHFWGAETIKVQYSAYEFDSRTLAANPIRRGVKNLQDCRKFNQLRKVATARTHTGYLVFLRVAQHIQQ